MPCVSGRGGAAGSPVRGLRGCEAGAHKGALPQVQHCALCKVGGTLHCSHLRAAIPGEGHVLDALFLVLAGVTRHPHESLGNMDYA